MSIPGTRFFPPSQGTPEKYSITGLLALALWETEQLRCGRRGWGKIVWVMGSAVVTESLQTAV